jgi:predicted ATPase
LGPNGAGKSNVLKVFDFLADIIRTDLQPAFDTRGGFDETAFWGGHKPPTSMRIHLKATWTTNSTLNAPDEYSLTIRHRSLRSKGTSERSPYYALSREESFAFKPGRDAAGASPSRARKRASSTCGRARAGTAAASASGG